MKNIVFKVIAVVAFALCSISCTSDSADNKAAYRNSFLASTEAGAYVKGSLVKGYDSTTDQIVYTDSKSTFMITNTAYTSHFTLSLSGTYIVGYTVTAECSSAGVSALSSGSFELSVIQTDDANKTYWLWDSTTSTGFILNFTL